MTEAWSRGAADAHPRCGTRSFHRPPNPSITASSSSLPGVCRLSGFSQNLPPRQSHSDSSSPADSRSDPSAKGAPQVTRVLEDDSNKVPAVSFNRWQLHQAASPWRQEVFRGPWTLLCARGLDQTWRHRGGRCWASHCRNVTQQPVCAEEQAPESRSVSSSGLNLKGPHILLLPHSPTLLYSPACVRTKATSASYCRCWSLWLWRRWCFRAVTHSDSFRINVPDISTLDEHAELWTLQEHHRSEEPPSQLYCRTLLVCRDPHKVLMRYDETLHEWRSQHKRSLWLLLPNKWDAHTWLSTL